MSDWKDRPVLITGATGFIGSHLAERLVAEGAQVRVLVRDPQKLLASLCGQVEVVRGDLLQPGCFAAAGRRAHPPARRTCRSRAWAGSAGR